MATLASDAVTSTVVTELSERQRDRALDRYKKLRPHLEHDAPLAGVAKAALLPMCTAQRCVGRYRRFGLIGLIRAGRADQGKRRRVPDDLRRLAVASFMMSGKAGLLAAIRTR
jgi:putative transposase